MDSNNLFLKMDRLEKILRILIEYTPLDYIIGDLQNEKPWEGLKRCYDEE